MRTSISAGILLWAMIAIPEGTRSLPDAIGILGKIVGGFCMALLVVGLLAAVTCDIREVFNREQK